MERKRITLFIAQTAVFTALTFAATVVMTIPMPTGSGGYINFGDTVILFASVLLGPSCGALAGGLGSLFADLIFAPQYALVTFLVKGAEGLVTGLLYRVLVRAIKNEKYNTRVSAILAQIAGGLVMVLGYYVGGGILLTLLNEEGVSGFAMALADIPSNFIQMGVSVAIAYVITLLLLRTKYFRTEPHA